MIRVFIGVLAGLLAASSTAFACDKLVEIPPPRIEELMQVMKEGAASELKQLLAFEELSCSDRPAVRKFAVDTGLASKSKTLRAQSLAALLMQRDQIRVELLEELKGNQVMENWIRQNGRDVAYKFHARDPAKNCIALEASYKCPGPYMVAIDGLNARLVDSYKRLTGTFTLQPDNSLRGTVLVDGAAKAVAAKIELDK